MKLTSVPFMAALATAMSVGASLLNCPAGQPASGPAILDELRRFREMGSVLYVAAHPDDENTQLITYLARGRHYRTAYLSLTRGDGGQNVLGPEFGEELGVIRTQELLAARRLDGGRQFFTRAIDFGFSKDYAETLRIWDRQQVLSDIVRVIRTFRPDVLVTRFSPRPGGTHGHHTSSAVLALEAFKLAGDANAFADQIATLGVWQPKRIFWNGFSRGDDEGANTNVLRMEIGGEDPVLGESFGDIAGRSRSMHKTQGFGTFGGGARGSRTESFQLLAGEPASKDILDGVDATWARVSGGAEVGRLADDIISHFDPKEPAASVPDLLKLRTRLAALPKDRVVDEKRADLDKVLAACLGLTAVTSVADAAAVPGETLHLSATATVTCAIPVRWVDVRYPANGQVTHLDLELRANQPAVTNVVQLLPASTPLSQPYWLREDHPIGMYRVAQAALIGRPENPPAFPIEHVFEVGGQTLVIPDEPVQLVAAMNEQSSRRHLQVIPPLSLKFDSEVRLFAPGSTHDVTVDLTSSRPNIHGTVRLDAPERWGVAPSSQAFELGSTGEHKTVKFTVTAPPQAATAHLTADAQVGDASITTERIAINYPHIPAQLLQPVARLKAVGLELAILGHQVGYVPGAGDNVAESLEQMGYTVSRLKGDELTPERLRGLDALVFGVRAFNVRTDLATNLPAVFAFVEAGGTVIVQYNRPNGLHPERLAPYELHLSNDRITDETAPVTFLAPEHPALNVPNKITNKDFDDWLQERGLYFPDRWDDHFTPLLACSDPGEAPLKGSLLVAQYGRGHYVYTGLAWFRQLPAGVPGAYRLFANLVSLGKSTGTAAGEGAKP